MSDGLRKVLDGLGKVSDGLGKVSDGLKKVSTVYCSHFPVDQFLVQVIYHSTLTNRLHSLIIGVVSTLGSGCVSCLFKVLRLLLVIRYM